MELTHQRIKAMSAGDEINAAVAIHIMGWTLADRVAMGWGSGPSVWITGEDPDDRNSSPTLQDFRPSESIKDAWKVVERFGRWKIIKRNAPLDDQGCDAYRFTANIDGLTSTEATAPLAICRAALHAIVKTEKSVK